MKTVCEILSQYPTDKNTTHHYGPVYESLLAPIRKESKVVIELGIDGGGSLRAWRDYFDSATIYGIDIRKECLFCENRIVCIEADETEPANMTRKLLEFVPFCGADLIIDDGSHHRPDQLMALFTLWPFVKAGGIYVIEDLREVAGPMSKMYQVETYDVRVPGGTFDDVLHVYRKKV